MACGRRLFYGPLPVGSLGAADFDRVFHFSFSRPQALLGNAVKPRLRLARSPPHSLTRRDRRSSRVGEGKDGSGIVVGDQAVADEAFHEL